ncbi:MAG: DUF1552 domain-containing protein [Deltaproteobacteria bacterium]|jgi:hypothetical protein|nr:DUF1552 domain-containing protein [Deltaproteobacteria bacterium]MBT6490713.1 DUF1552 domain-containing protein [Deltaproteobacteria bacterium]
MSFRWSKFRLSQNQTAKGAISRRAFLGGAGAMLSLPLFESLLPVGRQAFAADSASPVRLLFYYVPNGMHMPDFIPETTGSSYTIPTILEPLSAHRANLNVISGLANRAGEDNVPGDHARGTGSFLTCNRVVKTDGDGIQNGVSVDQFAAQNMGIETPFASLQLGTAGGSSVGDCDSGYSCAYSRNISWADSNTPLAKVTNPRLAFDRLFGGFDSELSAEAVERRRLYRLSMLDALVEDSLSLRARLNTHDAQKLDEYLTGVRELEVRVMEAEDVTCAPGTVPPDSFDFETHVQLMTGIMVKAFQCDMTRLISFMLSNAGSNQSYSFLGVSGAHHEISHHQNVQENFDKLKVINQWEVAQFASLLDGLAAVPEGEGTLLDQSLVFFSSEIADGNSHQHTNLPIILAGSGGGASAPGRHIQYSEEAPVANLFISMLAAVGVEASTFGMDGTGPLTALTDLSL